MAICRKNLILFGLLITRLSRMLVGLVRVEAENVERIVFKTFSFGCSNFQNHLQSFALENI